MKRILFLLCAFLATASTLFSQSKVVEDSLMQIINKTSSEKQKGVAYFHLASEISETKPEEAIGYAQKGMAIARKLSDTTLIIDCDIQLGIANDNLGNIAEAFRFNNEALDLAQKTHNEILQASCYINIGMGYAHARQDSTSLRKALESYQKALAIELKAGDKEELSNTCMSVGIAYFDMENYDSALVYYRQALSIAEQQKDLRHIAYSYNNIGTAYYMQKNYTLAAEYFEKGKKIKMQLADEKGMVTSYANLGELYGLMGRYEEALQNLDSGLTIAKRVQNKELIEAVYELQATVFTEKKDYQSALEAYKLFISYKDSIFDTQKSKDILDIENKYETTQKQRENDLLKRTTEIQRESLNRKDELNYVVSGGLVLVLAGAFFIFRAYSQKKKANIEISVQKVALEQKNKEIFDSINYAKKIQRAILAPDALLNENLGSHFVLYKPKDIVSGDFYWAAVENHAGEPNFFLAVCDSTGHGVPGAFMSLLNSSFLNEAISEKHILEPNLVFDHVRRKLAGNSSPGEHADFMQGMDGMDGMDGVLVRFEKKRATYAAAYNSPVLIRNGEIIETQADKIPVGKSYRSDSFRLYSLDLQPGDALYLFTDGFADQFGGPEKKKFKYRNLCRLLLSVAHLPMEEQKAGINQAFEDWRGEMEQIDDVCMIGIRIAK